MLRGSEKRIGPYKLGKALGKGKFSTVRYGQHTDTGETVAVKILDKGELSKAGSEMEVMQEVQIMQRVQHPNVVNLKEVVASKDSIYLIMEHVSGGSLFDRIVKQGPIEEPEAKGIFIQLMDGMEFCHMNGVFHRDIKAANVLVSSGGAVKLADFGLGALSLPAQDGSDEADLLQEFCGTANCVAPEVLARRGYAGGPADVWALGVLLYFLTAGRPAFSGTSFTGLRFQISKAMYHVPLWFSLDLVDFLSKILVSDPSDRASLSELRHHAWIRDAVAKQRWKELHPASSAELPKEAATH